MDFLTDEDLSFSENKGGEIKWETLFVQPLKSKGQKLRLRPVVSFNNDSMYLKNVSVHKFLKAVGQTVCINTKKNIEEGKGCTFCKYLKDKLNPIYEETYYVLKELGYELNESDLKGLLIARADAVRTKKDPKIMELKDKANLYEMSSANFYNYLPVIDVTDPGRVKLYEHKSMIKKDIKAFHDNGKDIKNFDIIITRTEERGKYYSVTREDQSELTEDQKEVIAKTLPEVEKALEVMFGEKSSSYEANKEKLEKYSAKLEGREYIETDKGTANKTATTPQEVSQQAPVAPAPESFTVEPY